MYSVTVGDGVSNNHSLSFDGVDDYIRVPDQQSQNFNSSASLYQDGYEQMIIAA